MKKLNFIVNDVKLIEDDDNINEAFASVSKNPNVTWIKFILTDDLPNGNKDRIPKDEFSNIIRTGLFMPIKMAAKEISQGHDGTFPLGSIAQLVEVENRVEGIAALWNRERDTDISVIKARYASGKSIDISWEITFDSYDVDGDIKNYKGVSLNAATVVGIPAYQGRTPITAVAAKEEKTMETVEKTKHEEVVGALQKELETYKTQIAELSDQVKEIKETTSDYDALKKFKEEYDAEQQRLARVAELKKKFDDAKLEIDLDDDQKVATLLELSDNALNFYIQDLVAFASDGNNVEASQKERKSITSRLPEITTDKKQGDLVGYLRNLDSKSGGK